MISRPIFLHVTQLYDFAKYTRLKDSALYIPKYGRKKVQVGNDQEKAQSEKDSHSKNRGGKKQN